MARAMLVLGDFVISLANENEYEQLTRNIESGWKETPRFGGKPLLFHHSKPLKRITISGKWLLGNGIKHSEKFEQLIDSEEPLLLSNGAGKNLGRWVVKSFQADESRHLDDGTPLVMRYNVDIMEYPNDTNQNQ